MFDPTQTIENPCVGDEVVCMMAAADGDEAPLSRFERLAVRVGAWAGGVALRWQFGNGPFFAYDGHLAAEYDADDSERPACRPTAPACG